ncbi:MAG: hypothetical protein AABZ06_02425 [Bdellovibrionota bacterium]
MPTKGLPVLVEYAALLTLLKDFIMRSISQKHFHDPGYNLQLLRIWLVETWLLATVDLNRVQTENVMSGIEFAIIQHRRKNALTNTF